MSAADSNQLGGYPAMNQGTYHGEFIIRDLANPNVIAAIVPAVLILGNGLHTPTMVAAPQSVSLTIGENQSTVVNISMSDASKQCGYAYSSGSTVSWATLDPDQSSGVVVGSGPNSGPGGDTGGGAGVIPVDIDTTGLVPGTYHGSVVVQSQNAEPNPVTVPIVLTVSG